MQVGLSPIHITARQTKLHRTVHCAHARILIHFPAAPRHTAPISSAVNARALRSKMGSCTHVRVVLFILFYIVRFLMAAVVLGSTMPGEICSYPGRFLLG